MAYLNRTIRIAFDGTGVIEHAKTTDGSPRYYPNLGPDVWVEIRNPMLMPPSMLLPKRDVPVDANNQPLDRHAAMEAGAEVMAGLVVDWSITDPLDLSDDAPVLPVPVSLEDFLKAPVAVSEAVGDLIERARNPR